MKNYVYKRFIWLYNQLENFRVGGFMKNIILNSTEYIDFLELTERHFEKEIEDAIIKKL